MAVKVTTTRTKSGGGSRVDTHEAANDFFVKDGHLHATKSLGGGYTENVAVYAPGEWRQAVIETAAQ